MIGTAVVVVVVLAVVLFPGDMATLDVFGVLQLRPFLTGHDTVGFGAGLHVFDALLSALDLLTSNESPASPAGTPELSTIPDGDMPR